MTANDAIGALDAIKPNAYSDAVKLMWLSTLAAQLQTEVWLLPAECVEGYSAVTDVLLDIPPAYSELWVQYLAAMVDAANAEFERYGNSMALFNATLGAYTRWFSRVKQPTKHEKTFTDIRGYLMQGDAYRLEFTLELDEAPLTEADVSKIELCIGALCKTYPDGGIDFADGWGVSLTQSETLALLPGWKRCQLRVKLTDGSVFGQPVESIAVLEGLSREIL